MELGWRPVGREIRWPGAGSCFGLVGIMLVGLSDWPLASRRALALGGGDAGQLALLGGVEPEDMSITGQLLLSEFSLPLPLTEHWAPLVPSSFALRALCLAPMDNGYCTGVWMQSGFGLFANGSMIGLLKTQKYMSTHARCHCNYVHRKRCHEAIVSDSHGFGSQALADNSLVTDTYVGRPYLVATRASENTT